MLLILLKYFVRAFNIPLYQISMNKYTIAKKLKPVTDKVRLTNSIRNVISFYENIIYKNSLKKNIIFYNKHKGERCFILGTGLSINSINLDSLSKETVLSGNLIYQHQDFSKLNLDYYFLHEPFSNLKLSAEKSIKIDRVIDSKEKMRPYLSKDKVLVVDSLKPDIFYKKINSKLTSKTKIFLHISSQKFVESNKIFANKDVFYTLGSKPMIQAKNQILDLSKGITFSDGILFVMFAAAIYMGFKEIYLVGIDYSFEPTIQFHFYDSPIIPKSISKSNAIELINNLAFARGVEVYSIDEDEKFYKPVFIIRKQDYSRHIIVKNILTSRRINVYNVTPRGYESPIYEKISWAEVLLKINKGS